MIYEKNKAYIAGFFDGEGSFKTPRGSGKSVGSTGRWDHGIAFYQNNLGVLVWIKSFYGGYLMSGHGKKANSLNMSSKIAEKCVNDMLPFLIVKKSKAEAFLKFRSLIKRNRSHLGDHYLGRLSEEDIKERLELMSIISPNHK